LQPTQNLLVFIAQYSFPYVKKRIRVVKHRVQELSPIEVALDEMQMRVTELEEVVFMKPTDAKKLQLRLQVGTEHVQVQLLFRIETEQVWSCGLTDGRGRSCSASQCVQTGAGGCFPWEYSCCGSKVTNNCPSVARVMNGAPHAFLI
jgi:hypothetical protein